MENQNEESDEENPTKPNINDLASRNIEVRVFRDDEEERSMLNGLPSRRPSFEKPHSTAQPSINNYHYEGGESEWNPIPAESLESQPATARSGWGTVRRNLLGPDSRRSTVGLMPIDEAVERSHKKVDELLITPKTK